VLLLVFARHGLGDSPFVIRVVDEETGRGVPLVELKTTNEVIFHTDSAGVVAVTDPDLIGQKVYFHIRSHGYEYPADGFGYRGKALELKAGGVAELRLKRLNIAERLYRVTGGGIYRDSVVAGLKPPLDEPLLNAQVFGSDSVVNGVYHGRVFWFWGDTNRASYPLGNFHVPGAVSNASVNADAALNLTYFTDKTGFAKKTCEMPGEGPTWIGGLTVLRGTDDRERMFASYAKIKGFLTAYERGIVEWDDGENLWRKTKTIPLDGPLRPDGHTFLHREGGVEYVYFATPYPLTRVRAEVNAYLDVDQYESYTCLNEGSSIKTPVFDRDDAGRLRYSWKRNTPSVGPGEQAEFVKQKQVAEGELLLKLRDVESGKPVLAHGGSVNWNAFRKRWVLIAVEMGGTSSLLGEVWCAEADTPTGPWAFARKIVTHDKYTFYNPKQHPYFDKDGGRTIFFEGTYANSFSGNPVQTARYDYNQMLYKLNLDDPRLALPVAVFQGTEGFQVGRKTDGAGEVKAAFFALDCDLPSTISVSDGGSNLFWVTALNVPRLPEQVDLYRVRDAAGVVKFALEGQELGLGCSREAEPLGRVWRAP
jgi:hypothetical protein